MRKIKIKERAKKGVKMEEIQEEKGQYTCS